MFDGFQMQKWLFFFLKFKQLNRGPKIWMAHHQQVYSIIWEEIKNKNQSINRALSCQLCLQKAISTHLQPALGMSGRWNIFIPL